MSNEAITWALGQKVGRSSAKFVLVAMANIASTGEMTCFPSIQYLSDATCQDRKTVVENLRRLRESGHIIDTGERKGSTGQVPVYLLNSTGNGIVEAKSTENGAGPKTDINSTVFPYEQTRFSPLTGPKTGHGYQSTPKDTKGTQIDTCEETKPKRTKAAGKTSIADGFQISDRVREWAKAKGHLHLEARLENFVGAAKAKGYVYADWDQAFMNAIRDDWAKLSHQPAAMQNKPRGVQHGNFGSQDYRAGIAEDGSF